MMSTEKNYKTDSAPKTVEMVDQKDGAKVPENAEVGTKTEDTTCKGKIKKFKANIGDRNHPYYWDKMLVLEFVEMFLSSVNLYEAFRLGVWNSAYFYLMILIFVAIAMDLISIVEYVYVRFFLFPSQFIT